MMFVEVLYQNKEFEDIRIHKSKNRQHNVHMEKKRRTHNVLQNIITVSKFQQNGLHYGESIMLHQ